MPLYLNASSHPDYLEIFSGVTLNVKDGVFDEESSASSFAEKYFQSSYDKKYFLTLMEFQVLLFIFHLIINLKLLL